MDNDKGIPPTTQVRIERRHATDLDHPHEIEPTYVNHAFVSQVGSDVFLDMCVLPPDDLFKASQGTQPEIVRIITVERFVMGLAGFSQLHDQVSAMHALLLSRGLLPVEPAIKLDMTLGF